MRLKQFFTLLLLILTVVKRIDSLSNLQHFISTEKIEAEDYSLQYNCTIYHDCSSEPSAYYVGGYGNASSRAVLEYRQVDFGTGVKTITVHVANVQPEGTLNLQLTLDTYDSYPLAFVAVNYTGNDTCDFSTLVVNLESRPSGVRDFFLTFPATDTQLPALFVDWFFFNQSTSAFVATDKIEAEDYTNATDVYVINDCPSPSIYYLYSLGNDSLIEYTQVNFGALVEWVTVSVDNLYAGTVQRIHLHLDSPTNDPIVTISVGQTGSESCDFFQLDTYLDIELSGVHDLFFTFSSPLGVWLHVDWFQFK